ncbi:hypothetical protein ACSQ67_016016 [Phaseolus vulgaris]
MTIVGKGVSFLWVLILIVLSSNNSRVFGQLIIEVTNALDNGSLDLTVACPNIDGKSYLRISVVSMNGLISVLLLNREAHHSFVHFSGKEHLTCLTCTFLLETMIAKSVIGLPKRPGPCGVYNRPNKPTICSKWD